MVFSNTLQSKSENYEMVHSSDGGEITEQINTSEGTVYRLIYFSSFLIFFFSFRLFIISIFSYMDWIVFREFTFSPSVPLRLDYQGKRVKSDQGVLMGLLIGLTSLKCSELTLVDFKNTEGLNGIPNCIQVIYSSF